MAQRKQLTWTELRVGIFVLVGLFIVMIAIFYVTGAGSLGPKYSVVTYLPEVEGMKSGAPVDLDGIQIGNVQSMSLTPHPTDREHSIKLVLRIGKKYQGQIRTDSAASLVTQGLLGDRYVTISRGLTGSVIPPNGEVRGVEEAAMKEVIERGADLMQNLGTLTDDIRDVIDQVQKGKGTLGALLSDRSLYNHLDDTTSKLDAVVTSVQEGKGSFGKLMVSDELYNKVDATVGDVQNVTAAVREQKGTVGKLIYDPAAYDEIKGFAQKGNALLGDMRAGKGTLGKLATDDTAYNNLRDASASVRDATAKLNSNQGTAGKFFSDPAFYDNMTGLSGDLRLMINDFRQNPKKFLHIKLGIF
ncbi:MAG: MlaD family protein [Candidatus Acidiferrales bacterium]|jgi:phospholipid/cholesterol/gamma-HCH transport system substrate-binding protein